MSESQTESPVKMGAAVADTMASTPTDPKKGTCH